MDRRVIAELAIIPIGTSDVGLSHHVAACIDVLDSRQDLSYQLTAMGTIIEGPLDKVLEIVHQMHEVPFSRGVSRVVTTLKIDDRRDKPATMANKVESVVKLHMSGKV